MTNLSKSGVSVKRYIKSRNISDITQKTHPKRGGKGSGQKKKMTIIPSISGDIPGLNLSETLTGRKARLRGLVRRSVNKRLMNGYSTTVGAASGDYQACVVLQGEYKIEREEYGSDQETQYNQDALKSESQDRLELQDLLRSMAKQVADSRNHLDRISSRMDATIERFAGYKASIEESKKKLGLGD